MKKLLLLLLLILLTLLPNISFAAEKVIWSKNLGNGIVWQQTEKGDILKYKNKIIESTEGFMNGGQFLCAYQDLGTQDADQFTPNERKKLTEIGAIKNGEYNPSHRDELTQDQLKTLYRITSRYCEAKTYTRQEIGKRWIYISTPLSGYVFMYDTKYAKLVPIFDAKGEPMTLSFEPEREIQKGTMGYFGIGNVGGVDYITFVPLNGKSYIDGMMDFLTTYSQANSSLIIDSYKLIGRDKIRVTYHLLSSKPMTEEFQIVTPK